MENEIIVGLDIGTTKIACFVGIRGEKGKVKILGYGKTDSDGVEFGAVRNVELASKSVRKAVEQASNQANVEIEEVWVGVAGQHIKSRPSHGYITIPADHELITQEDVELLNEQQNKTMLDPGESILHVFAQKYIVDGVPLSPDMPPVGVAGKTLEAEFHMVTANINNLQNIKLAVNMAGLKIKDIVLEPVASALAVLDDGDRDAGVAMVDIGGGTTDMAIFCDKIIRYTSVIPLAGNAITNDIRTNFQILRNQAESLKVKFGSCIVQAVNDNDVISIPGIRSQAAHEVSVKALANVINMRTRMIMDQVDYDIKMSGLKKSLIGGIVLTGGGAKLKDLSDFCELVTGVKTRIGTPDEHLDKESTGYAELSHPMFATGIGLVLYGFMKIEEEEKALAAKKSKRRKDIFFGMPDAEVPETDDEPEIETKKDTQKTKKPEDVSKKIGFLQRIGATIRTIVADDVTDEPEK